MELPNTLFAIIEDQGTTDEFLNANADKTAFVEIGETETVGEYVLQRTFQIKGVAQEI